MPRAILRASHPTPLFYGIVWGGRLPVPLLQHFGLPLSMQHNCYDNCSATRLHLGSNLSKCQCLGFTSLPCCMCMGQEPKTFMIPSLQSDISKAVNRDSGSTALGCPTWRHLSDADSSRREDKKWHWLYQKRERAKAKNNRTDKKTKIGAQSGGLLFCLPPSRLDIFRKTPMTS